MAVDLTQLTEEELDAEAYRRHAITQEARAFEREVQAERDRRLGLAILERLSPAQRAELAVLAQRIQTEGIESAEGFGTPGN